MTAILVILFCVFFLSLIASGFVLTVLLNLENKRKTLLSRGNLYGLVTELVKKLSDLNAIDERITFFKRVKWCCRGLAAAAIIVFLVLLRYCS